MEITSWMSFKKWQVSHDRQPDLVAIQEHKFVEAGQIQKASALYKNFVDQVVAVIADLNTYTPFTVIPDSLSVVDGKICMEFPPSDDENFFFRFRIE